MIPRFSAMEVSECTTSRSGSCTTIILLDPWCLLYCCFQEKSENMHKA